MRDRPLRIKPASKISRVDSLPMLTWRVHMDRDTDYHQRRAFDEYRAALSAQDEQARHAHLELAERHEEQARALGSGGRRQLQRIATTN